MMIMGTSKNQESHYYEIPKLLILPDIAPKDRMFCMPDSTRMSKIRPQGNIKMVIVRGSHIMILSF